MPHTNRTTRHDLPGRADRDSFHPNAPADWLNPAPQTVQQGLDDLAAAATAAALPVADSTALVKGSADGSKQVRMEVDGIATGTTRVLTMPDSNVDLGNDFAAAVHNHAASAINSGTLALARGGAGADVSTFTAGELVRLNAGGTALESSGKNVTDLHTDAGARVYNSANTSILTSTWTTLAFDSEHYDTNGSHSTSSNTSRLTAKTSGKHLIWYGGIWDFNATGARIFDFMLNGTTGIGRMNNRGDTHQFSICTVYDLAENDYVEIRVFQDAGVSLDMRRIANWAFEFAIQLIAKT